VYWQRFKIGLAVIQLTLFALVARLNGDMLIIDGESSPRYGRLVNNSDDDVVLFRARVGEDTEELSLPRDKVELLIVNFDEQRLSQLDPGKLRDYRDYAEELSAQKRDPVARELAIRLYLIAAANGFQRVATRSVAESGLAGLPGLARNEAEKKAFEVLRFIYDRQDHLPRGEPEATATAPEDEPIDTQTQSDLLQALRRIRREDSKAANEILTKEAVRKELERWTGICSTADIQEMLSTNRLSHSQLAKLLKLELAIQSGELPKPQREPTSWADQSIQSGQGWTQLPDFATVTEFDPFRSIYRNGEWVKPAKPGR